MDESTIALAVVPSAIGAVLSYWLGRIGKKQDAIREAIDDLEARHRIAAAEARAAQQTLSERVARIEEYRDRILVLLERKVLNGGAK